MSTEAQSILRTNLIASFALVLVVGLLLRVYIVFAFPPNSDIYYYDTQAAQLILSGVDPYGHQFTGIPPSMATPGAQNVFAYLPFTAAFIVPFYLLGDVRFATVAADLIIGTSLFQYSRRWSLLVAALFLLVPTTYYTNDAALGAAFVAVAIALESRGRRLLAALSLGVALATSLFVWLAVPFFAYRYAKLRDPKAIAVALATSAAVALPFLAAGPSSFLRDVVFFQFERVSPPLVTAGGAFGFTLNPALSGLMVTFLGQPAPLYLRVAVTLVVMALVLTLRRGRGEQSEAALWSSTLLRSSLFVAVSVFVLPSVFFFAYLEFPLVLLLVWLASR
jgi:uncharacterized membrane protein